MSILRWVYWVIRWFRSEQGDVMSSEWMRDSEWMHGKASSYDDNPKAVSRWDNR